MPGIYTGYLDCNIVGFKNQLLLSEEIKMRQIVKRETLEEILAKRAAEEMKKRENAPEAFWYDETVSPSFDRQLTPLLALDKQEYTMADVKNLYGVDATDKMEMRHLGFLTERGEKEYALLCAEALMRYDGIEDECCKKSIAEARRSLNGDASVDLEAARFSILDGCNHKEARIIADAVYCKDSWGCANVPEKVVDCIAKKMANVPSAILPADKQKEMRRGRKSIPFNAEHARYWHGTYGAVREYLAYLLLELLPG